MSHNLIGQTLMDQYQVVDFIASGGMGAVFRVWDLQRNVFLAMKSLHAELAEDPILLDRFSMEADALKRLSHPNIVPFYGLVQEDNAAFLIQKYIDGPSLKWIMRQRKKQPLPILEALAYLKAVCAALGYAHVNNIIHCDVKPANVMVDSTGNIYLTDFGIARQPTGSSDIGVIGTAAYMAPEQIRGEELVPATDIYAAGILLFEMLTGQRPFSASEEDTEMTGNSAVDIIKNAQCNQAVPDPKQLNPELSNALVEVIKKALSKDVADRYQSAQEYFEAACRAAGISMEEVPDRVILPESTFASTANEKLETVMVNGSPTLRVSNLADSEKKSGIPLSLILAGGAGVLVTLLLLMLVTFKLILPKAMPGKTLSGIGMRQVVVSPLPSDTLSPEEMPTNTATPLPTNTPEPTITNTPAETPKGGGVGQVAFASMRTGRPQIALIDVDGENYTALTDINGGACQPDWSPDGSQIVYISPCDEPHYYENYENASLYIMNADGSGQEKLPIDAIKGDFDPAWSPDGKKIAFVGVGRLKTDNSAHLYIYDIAAKSMTPIRENIAVREPQWSPDSTQIVFEMSRGNQVWIINADGSGKETTFSTGGLVAYTPNWSPDGIFIYYGQERNPMMVRKPVSERAALAETLVELTYYRPAWVPNFSPDGNYVVFTDSSDALIYTYRLGGDKWDVEELAAGFSPAWRP